MTETTWLEYLAGWAFALLCIGVCTFPLSLGLFAVLCEEVAKGCSALALCLHRHDWNGCICRRTGCRATRPEAPSEAHSWNGCVCRNCYARRDMEHEWAGCRCKRCRGIREEMRPMRDVVAAAFEASAAQLQPHRVVTAQVPDEMYGRPCSASVCESTLSPDYSDTIDRCTELVSTCDCPEHVPAMLQEIISRAPRKLEGVYCGYVSYYGDSDTHPESSGIYDTWSVVDVGWVVQEVARATSRESISREPRDP